MGFVYKAEDVRLRRTVALKFLTPAWQRDPSAKDRFIHEAQAASALDHPNLCTVYEVGETVEGLLFIAMAYYEGETTDNRPFMFHSAMVMPALPRTDGSGRQNPWIR